MPETVTEIPKALFDATVQMQIRTGRYASKTVRDIIGLLNQADADILRKIAATDAPFTKARLAALLKEIRTVYREIYSEAGSELKQQMLDFAGVRADQTAALIATQLPVNYNIIQATAEQLKAIVDVAPVTVGPDKKLLLEEIFTSLAAGKEESIRGAIRLGMVEGETISQMVQRLRGTKANQYKDGVLEVSRRHAEAMTRTIVNHTSNQAMQATYANNDKVVKGWIFTATLDGRTSITCASLAGTVWPVGKGPLPPRHVRCRSISVPEIATWRELGFDLDELPPGMRASKDGLVRSDISFQDWLKGQDKATQIDILGKTRAELFRSGKVEIPSFADDMGRVLTLDQLKASGVALPQQNTISTLAKNLKTAENEIRGLSFEKCRVFGSSGNMVFKKSGQASQINFTSSEGELFKDTVFTHNHPRGSAFSPADLFFAKTHDIAEMRAVSTKHDYSIKRPDSGWDSKDNRSANAILIDAETYVRKAYDKINDSGRMTERIAKNYYHSIATRFAQMTGAEYTKTGVVP